MMNWLINLFFFFFDLSFSSSSNFFYSSIDSFEIRECDDVHVKCYDYVDGVIEN